MPRKKKTKAKSDDTMVNGDKPERFIGSNTLMPDVEMPLGLANVNRHFAPSTGLDDHADAGPSIIVIEANPMAAFTSGWSEDGSVSDGDTHSAAAIDTGKEEVSMTPITYYANAFAEDIWPLVNSIFQSGLGARPVPDISQVVRYLTNLLLVYECTCNMLTFNKLAYHHDWRETFPFTPDTPKWLYDVCEQAELNDIDIARKLFPVMQRLESFPVFPLLFQHVRRVMTPTYTLDGMGRILLPKSTALTLYHEDPWSVDMMHERLDFIELHMSALYGMMRSFIPWTLSDIQPFQIPAVVEDPERVIGIHNSGFRGVSTYGDTGDPNLYDHLMFNKEGDSITTLSWHGISPQPMWSQMKWASIYELEIFPLDNTYSLVTRDKYGHRLIPTDAGQIVSYDNNSWSPTDLKWHKFIQCRWWDRGDDANHGLLDPGLIGGRVNGEGILRCLYLQADRDFMLPEIKRIAQVATGSSLREIREVFRPMSR